jgi:hypothetical protein
MKTQITVMKNMNTSPKANLENEKREKGLIVEDYENLDGVNEILEILEQNGLISKSNLDRIDQDKRLGHAHYYFDSKLDNNSLRAIIDNYVNNGQINQTKLNHFKNLIGQSNTIDQLGILDTQTQGFNIDAQTSQLLNNNIDNFQYITKDKNGITTYKKFTENLGLSGADKPTNVLNNPVSVQQLQGIYDFTFHFDTDIEQFNISDTTIKQALENALNRYNNPDLSLLNLTSSIKENSLNINFNNLLKNPASNDFFMVSKKNIKDVLDIFLKELAKLANLTILNNGFKFYKDQVEIDQILNRTANKQAKKSGQPTTQATTTTLTAQGETLGQIEVEKYIDYLAELKTKSIDEVIAVETTLKENAQKLESVKGILSDEVINEKNKEIADKLVLLDIVKSEKLEEIKIKEALDEANKELATTKAELEKTTQELTTAKADNERLDTENKEQSKRIDVINKDLDTTKTKLETTTQTLNKANEDNKKLGDENKEQSKRIDVISKDLDTTKKQLEQSRTMAAQTASELKASKELNEKGKKYAEQQGVKIEELTTEKRDLQTENQRLQDEINMLNEENYRLGNNSNNNKKGNNNGRAPK